MLLEPPCLRGFLSSAAEVDSSRLVSGPRVGRAVSSPDVVESSDEVVDVGGEQVGVAVHGDGDRRVAEVDLDGFGGGAGGGEETGAGMAEVMDPQSLGQFCLFDGPIPDLAAECWSSVAASRLVW